MMLGGGGVQHDGWWGEGCSMMLGGGRGAA